MLKRVVNLTLVLVQLAAAACGGNDSAVAPVAAFTMNDVAGTYRATEFTSTMGNQTTDQLRNGGSVRVTINSNGSWRSDYIVAPGGSGTMSGAWTLSGTQVRLMDFDLVGMPTNYLVRGDLLIGSHGFGVVVIQLTLKRE
jgi:hypothetical protein